MLTCCNNSTSSRERSVEFRGREMRRLQEESAPKKQHYVPQYYLRRFSDDGDSLWVFNRKAGRTYKSRSEDVCERNYHYEMEARCQRSWHGRHLLPGKIEKKLSEMEGEQALLLREIDAQLDAGRIHEKERRALLWLVGHLIARHPAMLEGYEPDYDAMYGDPEVRWAARFWPKQEWPTRSRCWRKARTRWCSRFGDAKEAPRISPRATSKGCDATSSGCRERLASSHLPSLRISTRHFGRMGSTTSTTLRFRCPPPSR